MTDVTSILTELGDIFGQSFVDSVLSELDEKAIGESVLAPSTTSQQKKEKSRPEALKKAMAAFAREGERYKQKKGMERYRKAMSDIQKDVKRHDKDPDAVEKALADLRAMSKDRKARGAEDDTDKGHSKAKGKDKDQVKTKAAAASGGGGGAAGAGGGAASAKQKDSGKGGSGKHDPFKRSSSLGKGPGTPPGFKKVRGSVKHNKAKCWNCECGDIYKAGCVCKGTGANKWCPKGATKNVKINRDYRQAYNKMYHAWRAKKGGDVTARVGKGQSGSA